MIKDPAQARYYTRHREERCKKMRAAARVSRGQRNAYLREWRVRQSELERGRRTRYRLKKYGLTIAQYEEILKQQKGLCAICGSSLVLGALPCRNSANVDHKEDRVRGILCNGCNQALGLFRDDTDVLIRAVEYVLDNGGTVRTILGREK